MIFPEIYGEERRRFARAYAEEIRFVKMMGMVALVSFVLGVIVAW